ncbi:hypothetical protein DL98DRAFT_643617 [Cadophora sp. DSE1049]|nr:hypothetical protein DL98DRAFT_643617 [Cadophora sp. DSE1049]
MDFSKHVERKSLPEPPVEEPNHQPSSKMVGNGESLRRTATVSRKRDTPGTQRQPTTESTKSTGYLHISDMTDQEVREALAISHERHMAAEAQLNIATEKLASLHSTDPFRESDDSIIRKMEELRHDIKQWSRKLSLGVKKPGVVKKAFKAFLDIPDNESPFQGVSRQWRDFLDEEKVENGASKLVQSYVWKYLMIDVFDVDCQVWLGGQCVKGPFYCPMYEPFHKMNAMIYLMAERNKTTATAKQYYHWRAQTVRILANSSGRHEACIDRNVAAITKKISSVLKDYSSEKNAFGDNEFNGGKNNLATIVRSAVALDLLLWQQKAYFPFRIYYPNSQALHPFSSFWMTADLSEGNDRLLEERRCIANLFSAPALYKDGTSDGENYGESIVLCKACVHCLPPS